MIQVSSEYNYKRKSHRVDIPLLVEINGEVHQTKDWSVTGVGISGLNMNFEPDTIVPGRIILPMSDTTISLSVMLAFRNVANDTWGFEIHDIKPKHKRMLRHYIEMAIDGRIENVEDLISVATAPPISSPIEDALNLTDIEHDSLTQKFKTNSRLSIVIGFILFSSIILTLFYNTTYRIRTIGVVAGNSIPIFSDTSGYVDNIFVEPGKKVKLGDPLLSIKQGNIEFEKSILERKLKALNEFLHNYAKPIETSVESNGRTSKNELITSLEEILEKRNQALYLAKAMYQEHTITRKDLDYIENSQRLAVINLQKEKDKIRNSESVTSQGRYRITLDILELKEELSTLIHESQEKIISATHSGQVYSVESNSGSYVVKGQTLAFIASDVTPYVYIYISNEKVKELKIGQSARIYVPSQDMETSATIESIGHESANLIAGLSNEITLNNTIVKLKLSEDITLPPFIRVEVLVRTFNWSF